MGTREAATFTEAEKPRYLAKLTCGHIEPFVLSPIIGWWEWCSVCKDFRHVVDGV